MTVRIIHGDCVVELPKLAASGERFHACVCDPPYHLTSIVKRFGATSQADDTQTSERARSRADGYARLSTGFMGKRWDGGDVAFRAETWRAVDDVLLPGAYLLAFGGTRTAHRLACAIEDAGFEIRDTIAWIYGSGFPKSHNLHGDWEGWGTALKPAFEPIIVARKPADGTVVANMLKHGCGALNIDASRIEASEGSVVRMAHEETGAKRGYGGGLRGGSRIEPQTVGRWPANVIHDGSEEVLAAFDAYGELSSGTGAIKKASATGYKANAYGKESRAAGTPMIYHGDTGSAARFFYSAKADAGDRAGSKHPTVKPTDLMRYLIRLIAPPGATVLDPFAGTGSTLLAADQLGFNAVGIEADPTYAEDARRKFVADAGMFAEIAP